MQSKFVAIVSAAGLLLAGCSADSGPKETGGAVIGGVAGGLIGGRVARKVGERRGALNVLLAAIITLVAVYMLIRTLSS